MSSIGINVTNSAGKANKKGNAAKAKKSAPKATPAGKNKAPVKDSFTSVNLTVRADKKNAEKAFTWCQQNFPWFTDGKKCLFSFKKGKSEGDYIISKPGKASINVTKDMNGSETEWIKQLSMAFSNCIFFVKMKTQTFSKKGYPLETYSFYVGHAGGKIIKQCRMFYYDLSEMTDPFEGCDHFQKYKSSCAFEASSTDDLSLDAVMGSSKRANVCLDTAIDRWGVKIIVDNEKNIDECLATGKFHLAASTGGQLSMKNIPLLDSKGKPVQKLADVDFEMTNKTCNIRNLFFGFTKVKF